MSEHELEQWNEAFEANPAATTAYIAEQKADEAAGRYLQHAYEVNAAQNAEVQGALLEQVGVQANSEMTSRYGDAWANNKGFVAQLIERDPALLPDADAMRVSTVVPRLEQALKIVAHDREVYDKRNSWERIKAAGANTYENLMAPRNPIED